MPTLPSVSAPKVSVLPKDLRETAIQSAESGGVISEKEMLDLVKKCNGELGLLELVEKDFGSKFGEPAKRVYAQAVNKLRENAAASEAKPLKARPSEAKSDGFEQVKKAESASPESGSTTAIPKLTQVFHDLFSQLKTGETGGDAVREAVAEFSKSPTRMAAFQHVWSGIEDAAKVKNPTVGQATDGLRAFREFASYSTLTKDDKFVGSILDKAPQLLAAAEGVAGAPGRRLMGAAIRGMFQASADGIVSRANGRKAAVGMMSHVSAQIAETTLKLAASSSKNAAEGSLFKESSGMLNVLAQAGRAGNLLAAGTTVGGAVSDLVAQSRDPKATMPKIAASALYLVTTLVGFYPPLAWVRPAGKFVKGAFDSYQAMQQKQKEPARAEAKPAAADSSKTAAAEATQPEKATPPDVKKESHVSDPFSVPPEPVLEWR